MKYNIICVDGNLIIKLIRFLFIKTSLFLDKRVLFDIMNDIGFFFEYSSRWNFTLRMQLATIILMEYPDFLSNLCVFVD